MTPYIVYLAFSYLIVAGTQADRAKAHGLTILLAPIALPFLIGRLMNSIYTKINN